MALLFLRLRREARTIVRKLEEYDRPGTRSRLDSQSLLAKSLNSRSGLSRGIPSGELFKGAAEIVGVPVAE
jgi:hypothetical protein